MIKIVERFAPFSHLPGTSSLIPGSPFIVEAYPAKLLFFSEKEMHEMPLDIVGPVEGFTLQQDLEKGKALFFGKGKGGYFHLTITHVGKEIRVQFLRGKEQRIPVESEPFQSPHKERLSLGVHKKLDWDLVLRRKELKEILPLLFFLGQSIPDLGKEKGQNLETLEDFSTLIQAGFRGIFVPKRMDTLFLGLNWKGVPDHLPLLSPLREGYEAIRSLFIREEKDIHIHPNLPKEFVSGRLVGILTEKALLDIEWTKGKLRRVTIHAKHTGEISFVWPKELTSFHLRRGIAERGTWVKTGEKLTIASGERYFLDKFQK